MQNKEKKRIDYLSILAILFVLLGLCATIYFMLNLPFNDSSNLRNPELFSQYGNFVGGFVGSIFTLAGFLLIYKTLRTQQYSIYQQEVIITEQRKMFELQKFETTFFNLLKTQRDIADNIKSYFKSFKDIDNFSIETVTGRDFFIYSKNELLNIWESLNSKSYSGIYDINDIEYTKNQLEDLYSEENRFKWEFEGLQEVKEAIINKVKLQQVNKFYNITVKKWESFKKLDKKEKTAFMYGIYFQKYDYIAGHYFRHLFHILDFVKQSETRICSLTDNQLEMNKNIKLIRKYVAFLQSQMSSLELLLLFYDAIAFPKMLAHVIDFNFLENLTVENLIDKTHNCINGIKLKSKTDLLK